MIPIEKNISVIDEFGKEYEATYPKRARGLVKKGRARFVDENTICLACPPNIMEDTKMSDNTNVNVNETAKTETAMPTVQYILEQIEWVLHDNRHIYEAITALSSMSDGEQSETPGAPSNMVGQAKAEAIADVVKCRETTNQKLLAFYEKVYDDLMNKDAKEKRMETDYQLKQQAITLLIDNDSYSSINAAMKLLGVDDGRKVQSSEAAPDEDPVDKAIDDAIDKSIEKVVNDSIAASIAQSFAEN